MRILLKLIHFWNIFIKLHNRIACIWLTVRGKSARVGAHKDLASERGDKWLPDRCRAAARVPLSVPRSAPVRWARHTDRSSGQSTRALLHSARAFRYSTVYADRLLISVITDQWSVIKMISVFQFILVPIGSACEQNPDAWALYGEVLETAGEVDAAKLSLERVTCFVKDASDMHSVYLRLARIYLDNRKVSAFIPHLYLYSVFSMNSSTYIYIWVEQQPISLTFRSLFYANAVRGLEEHVPDGMQTVPVGSLMARRRHFMLSRVLRKL